MAVTGGTTFSQMCYTTAFVNCFLTFRVPTAFSILSQNNSSRPTLYFTAITTTRISITARWKVFQTTFLISRMLPADTHMFYCVPIKNLVMNDISKERYQRWMPL